MSGVKRHAEEHAETVQDGSLSHQPKRAKEDDKPTVETVSDVEVKAKGIEETDVGITQYINSSIAGFQGVIKQRYTDFLVNEIDVDGKVIRFEDDGLGDLKRFRKEKRQKEDDKKDVDKNKAHDIKEEPLKVVEKKEFSISEEDAAKLAEYFPQDEINQLIDLSNNKIPKFQSSIEFPSKQERTLIHQLVRSSFQSKLESKTSDKNSFEFTISSKSSRKPTNRVNVQDTLDSNGIENYGLGPVKQNLLFNLYKENKDTMEVTSLIARMLRIPPKEVRFAGTKDRRGVTVQKCSIAKVKVERMNSLNGGFRGNVKIGGFEYSDVGVKLGALKGNEFLITIRDVKSNGTELRDEELQDMVQSLSSNGFINYYGMQRFGTFSISTHTIGKEILLSNWKAACELILSDQALVIPDSKPARQLWEQTRNAKRAAESMPKRCVAESVILKNLSQVQKEDSEGNILEWNDHDYFNAINKIPRNLRIMYGHAYQSYVWNCVTSKRLEMFGNEVVAGDLVLENGTDDETLDADDDEEAMAFEEDVRTDKYQRARAVSQDEVEQKKFTIFDIVLPMPGFDIKYPSNPQIMDIYTSVMGRDGLDPLDMVRKVKDFSFAGSYRKIVSRPKNVEIQKRFYKSPTQQLIYTDLQLLNFKKQGNLISNRILDQVEDEDNDKLAIILKFQLDVSSYATMMLREVMRMDTSRHGELCDVKQEKDLQKETTAE